MARSISRRSVLRGLAGTALALPLLEIMLNEHGEALADGGGICKRYVLAFGGYSLVTKQEGPDGFVPNQYGTGYDLKAGLAPLAAHGVHDRVSVVSGLEFEDGTPGMPTAPAGVNFFHRKGPAFFCGQSVIESDDKVPMVGTQPSSDQIVADAFQGQTTFHSLQYNVQADHYHTVEAWPSAATMSWKEIAPGQSQVVVPQASPQNAFQSLFTQFTPSDPALAQAKAFELAKRGSILDLVDRRGSRLIKQLGAADTQRVEQHLQHIRDLEILVSTTDPGSTTAACQMTTDPNTDPAIGGNNPSGFDGWATNSGWSDEYLRAEKMTELLHMALVCDLTRVATLMYTYIGSSINLQPISGVQKTFHSFHHHDSATQNDLNAAIAWHVDHWASLVAKLDATPEGTGTLLDNCALVMMNEGGRAPGYGSHSAQDLAFLFAGGAGGLKQGEHVDATGQHPGNVLITAMNAVGVPTNTLGELSGAIPAMVG